MQPWEKIFKMNTLICCPLLNQEKSKKWKMRAQLEPLKAKESKKSRRRGLRRNILTKRITKMEIKMRFIDL